MSPDDLISAGLGWMHVATDDGQHSIPVNDIKPHVFSADCWCRPEDVADESCDEPVWSHNSMDRREHTIEQGIVH